MAKICVDLIEFERGWGSKVDDTKEFDSWDDAHLFKNKFNEKNNLAEVPDWYMIASEPYEKRG